MLTTVAVRVAAEMW